MKARLALVGWILAGTVALTPGSQAGEILVGNLDQPAVAGSPYFIDAFNFAYQEFTTGSGNVQLESIIASLGNLDDSGGFSLLAQLFADDGNGPPSGPALTTFTVSSSTPIPASGYAAVQFDPATGVTLLANTSYWFALSGQSSSGGGQVEWQYTDSTSVTAPGGGSLPNAATYYVDPPTWNAFPNSPWLIQINVVPEPSSVALSAIAAGLLFSASAWRVFRRRTL